VCRLIQSKLFTFYIGKEKKAFVVHSKAIAATSWHFHALVNNGMVQSQEGSVEYPDMEPNDFARFIEYAYRYDYTPPSWILDERHADNGKADGAVSNSADEPQLLEEPIEDTPEWVAPAEVDEYSDGRFRKLGKSQLIRKLRQSFDEQTYLTLHEPRTTLLLDRLPQQNSSAEQDFTPVFLAHARLYTFACMRLIDPLKRLALSKLHETLRRFKLYNRRVSDVVELARYAYEHGEDRKSDGTIEDLRKLVVEYIACEVSTIGKHEAFALLLQEGGEFVVDFWRIINKVILGL
jgi:hypothetical protein